MRPSPLRCISVKAARQQRKEPVRFTRSVSSHISGVISAKGATSSTAAADTSAATGPTSAAAAKRRSTSCTLLTSAGAAVALPPASRIRPATAASASLSLAARTTCAPAAATASAVAAPIPRLAPVTTVTRPASQCPDSVICGPGRICGARPICGPGPGKDDPTVELLVRVQAQFQVEIALGMATAGGARNTRHSPDLICGAADVVRRDQIAGYAISDDLAEAAAVEGDHRGAAGLRLGGGHAEGLIPSCRAQDH